MACVIRNPVILHCLNEFGITPAEARAIAAVGTVRPPPLDEEWAALVVQLSDVERLAGLASSAPK